MSISLDENKGWIDFEREIALTLKLFKEILSSLSDLHRSVLSQLDLPQLRYIAKNFPFLTSNVTNELNAKYIYEAPLHSGNYIINQDEIAEDLFHSLLDFTQIMNTYFKYFVDDVTPKLIQEGLMEKEEIFSKERVAVTFNYTHTFEQMYPGVEVYHIHGEVDGNLILGINADESDNIDTMDNTFLEFKKYYQRVICNTDEDCQGFLRAVKADAVNTFTLHVIGHSLDVTDKDIVKELFEVLDKIIIYYHSEHARNQYVKNLVTIYGKQAFDKIRMEKFLRFRSLSYLKELYNPFATREYEIYASDETEYPEYF